MRKCSVCEILIVNALKVIYIESKLANSDLNMRNVSVVKISFL